MAAWFPGLACLRLDTIVKRGLSTQRRAGALQVQADLWSATTFRGMHMSIQLFKTWGRKALLLGSLALGLSQVGCAHPVVMEPSVVFSSQIGHAPVYAQVGVPGPVIYAPPRVIYAPPVYRPVPGWAYGHDRHWGHDRHEGGWGERRDGRRGGHGGHDDWRR